MLRSWSRSQFARRGRGVAPAARPVVGSFIVVRPSRGCQQPVLADDRRSANSCARSRPFFMTRMRSASDSTVSGSVETTMTPMPWSRRPRTICTTSSLAPTSMPRVGSLRIEHLRRWVSHLASADLLLVAAGQRAEPRVGARRPDAAGCSMWPSAISRSAAGFSQQLRDALEDADRDVLVDRLVVEQHGAPALRHEGDAGRARRSRCCASVDRLAVDARSCPCRLGSCRTARAPARAGRSP